MKQLVQNSRRRSLVVLATKTRGSASDTSEIALRESLAGWLNCAAPPLLHVLTWKGKTPQTLYGPEALSSIDQIRVDRATVRESHTHRHWPAEVVMKFMAADVIARQPGD
ncbi:MAG: hypothetical protein ABI923_11895 [bacterium]